MGENPFASKQRKNATPGGNVLILCLLQVLQLVAEEIAKCYGSIAFLV